MMFKKTIISMAVVLALASQAYATHGHVAFRARFVAPRQRVVVQKFVAPVYAAPAFVAPVYAAPAFSAPYCAPAFSAPAYSAPVTGGCSAFFRSY